MAEYTRARSSVAERGTFKSNNRTNSKDSRSRPVKRSGIPLSLCSVSFVLALRSERRKETTVAVYLRGIKSLISILGDKDATDISKDDIRKYLIIRQQQVNPTTALMDFRSIRVFFHWLVNESEIQFAPTDGIRQPSVEQVPPPVYTPDEINRLLVAVRGTRSKFDAVRNNAILLLLLDCGMRRNEIASINLEDVDLDQRVILLRVTKNGDPRIVPIGNKTTLAIDRYLRIRSRHKYSYLPFLWIGQKGRLGASGIGQLLKDLGDRAGVAGTRPHRFRHTFAHQATMNGMQTPDLMAIAGWKSVSMVLRYGKSAATERAILAHRKFSPVDGIDNNR